ncbi:MAG: DUF2842 domain-containing protein [Paracoccaceae bacterium]
MTLTYRTRRRLSLLLLLVWLPLYVVVAVTVVGWLGSMPFLVELLIYVVLGVLWALPFRFVFLGVGREPPEDESER